MTVWPVRRFRRLEDLQMNILTKFHEDRATHKDFRAILKERALPLLAHLDEEVRPEVE